MIVIANWKAYVEDAVKAKKLFSIAKKLSATKIKIVLAPSAPQIGLLAPGNTSKVSFAAQDISITTGGAHTGESSAQIFSSLGVSYAIIGHSERRAAGETRDMIALKVGHAIAQGLTPILCVGEKERDQNGEYLTHVRADIVSALDPLSSKERSKVIIAYEPVWAIGKSAAESISPSDLAEMTLYIRKVLAELLPGKAGNQTTVIYGGSVEPENVRDLAAETNVDGFLVGHASVEPMMFRGIVQALL